jgi:hypothetical protein
MAIGTKQMLQVIYILSWILFIGICIEAGGFIFSTIYTLAINPANTNFYWAGLDLTDLYHYDHGQFMVEMIHVIMVAVMRAILFYVIVKFLHDKKLNLSQPFNEATGRFIFSLSWISLFIGALSWWGVKYTDWLVKQGVKMPDIRHLRMGGADVWLFMGVTLYVIALIFKRGIEIQTENDLTI